MSDDKDDKKKIKEEKKAVAKEKSREVLSYYLKEPYLPFVICIILSLLFNEIVSLALLPWFISLYVGLAFLFLGLFMLRWALKHMTLNGETWSPLHMETRIMIVFGPYHFSRNPVFLGAVLLYISLFLFLNNLWGFILLLPLIALLNRYVIKPREKQFREMYGEVYDDYHQKTSRWI